MDCGLPGACVQARKTASTQSSLLEAAKGTPPAAPAPSGSRKCRPGIEASRLRGGVGSRLE
jgi:hypothetical protein